MTWLKFAFYLLGLYTSYYGVLICWDFYHAKAPAVDAQHELSFVEDVIPVSAHFENAVAAANESSVVSSGGVSLKQLFNLAREESVEYIKSVSF